MFVIWPFFNIFLKFHLLEYFFFRKNDIGEHCDAESPRTVAAYIRKNTKPIGPKVNKNKQFGIGR